MPSEEFIPTSHESATVFSGGEDIALHAASERLLSYEELARQRVGEALAAAVRTAPSGSLEVSKVEKEPLKPWNEIQLISGALVKIRQAYRDSHFDLTADDIATTPELFVSTPPPVPADATKKAYDLAA